MHSNPILSPADWLSPRRAAVTSAHEKRMEKSSHRMCGALHDHYDDYLVLFIFAVAAQKKNNNKTNHFRRNIYSPSRRKKFAAVLVGRTTMAIASQFHFYGKVVIIRLILIMHKIQFVLNYSGTWTQRVRCFTCVVWWNAECSLEMSLLFIYLFFPVAPAKRRLLLRKLNFLSCF